MRKKGNGEMKTKVLYGVIAVLVIALVAGGVLGYREYDSLKKENTRLMNPQESAKAEQERVKLAVEKLVDTPKDETPIIATVTDVDKLKSQPFYSSAQNGDKALFYEKAKRAILYRPSTNKIVNTSTIDIKANATATPAPATTPAPDTTAEGTAPLADPNGGTEPLNP